METAKLVLEYLQALIWPIVVGVLLFMLRNEIPRLVDRIKSVKVAGAEVELEALKARVEAEESGAQLRAAEVGMSDERAAVIERLAASNRPSSDSPKTEDGDPSWGHILGRWYSFTGELRSVLSEAGWIPNMATGSVSELAWMVRERLDLPIAWAEAATRIDKEVIPSFHRAKEDLTPETATNTIVTISKLHNQFNQAFALWRYNDSQPSPE